MNIIRIQLFTVLLFITSFLLYPLEVRSEVINDAKNTDTYVTGLTSARARSLVGGVIACASVIIGLRLRSKRRDHLSSNKWAKIGLSMAAIAIALSIFHLVAKTGTFGTGGGKAGAVVAIVLGVAGLILNLRVIGKDQPMQ